MKYGSRVKILLPLMLVSFVALSAWRLWPRAPELTTAEPEVAPTIELSGPTMGTTWKVTVVGRLSAADQDAVAETITRELDVVDAQMSTWRDDSDISRFNADVSTAVIPAPPELLAVVRMANDISAASDGAFDVTLAPLLDAWGFGPGGRKDAAPTPEQLDALRARTGWHKLHAGADGLRKDDPALRIELSAIAPGYAADRIVAALVAGGWTRHMVDVGGEIRVTGESPRGGKWRLGIERPDTTGGTIQEVVELADQALATSGDYRNYYERDGVRVSHTLDPRSGRPIAHKLASVSVILPSAALADGWATALNVLGPDAGHALAEARSIPALFLVRGPDGGFDERTTTPFAALRPATARATLEAP